MWLLDVTSWIITLAHVEIIGLKYILALLSILTNFFFATALVYKGLKQPEFFSGIEEKSKYAQSKLTKHESEKHVEQLLQFMKKSKPYLEPSLSLTELAENLDIHPRYLSQEINDTLNQNFYDFVNSYRVEEAKKFFSDPVTRKKTVLEILYEVGFNSKSVFNNAFKKQTGITPTQFKKNHQ
jgi:AraC-like DNA-binding protein